MPDREVALDRLPVGCPCAGEEAPVPRELLDMRLEPDVHPFHPVEVDELGREVGAPELRHQRVAHLYERHAEAARAKRGSRLGADEAPTDDNRGVRLVGRGRDDLGVGERPVRMHADEVGAGNRQLPRAGARGEDERAIRDALIGRELDLVLRGMNRLDRRLQPELDDIVLVLGIRPHERRVAILLLSKEALRQRGPVVRGIGLGREDRDLGLASRRAVLGGEPPCCEPASDENDRVGCHVGSRTHSASRRHTP